MRLITGLLLLSVSILSAHESPWTSADFLKHNFEMTISISKTPAVSISFSQDQKHDPAQEKSNDKELFEKVIVEWKRMLSEYKSTQLQAKFLIDNQTQFILKEPGLRIPSWKAATWHQEGIYINKGMIGMMKQMANSKDLEGDKEIAHIGLQMFPIVALELGHGFRYAEIERLLGSPMLITTREEEALALYEMIQVIREMEIKEPGSGAIYAKILNVWKEKGPSGLEEFASRYYKFSIISVSKDNRDEIQKKLDAYSESLKVQEIQKPFEKVDIKILMDRVKKAQLIFDDEKKTVQWREYYATKMKNLDEAWKKENGK